MVGANGVGHNACAARQVWCREAAVLCVHEVRRRRGGRPAHRGAQRTCVWRRSVLKKQRALF